MHPSIGAFLLPIAFARPRRMAPSTWVEHAPFAMNLVQAIRPRTIVELGTQHGVSYCAFCQAVSEARLATRCFAVDTWRGDEHAGAYGEEVLADLRAHHDQAYRSFSRLVQGTFDEAVGSFADGEIDLLHIDGLHTYEAVRHDFETWRPKLSNDAIALFHDTSVRERGFGVGRLWREVSDGRPAFEFVHGYGLGVLAVGDPPDAVRPLFALRDGALEELRAVFAELGQAMIREVEVRELRDAVSRVRADAAAASAAADLARAEAERAREDTAAARAVADAARLESAAARDEAAAAGRELHEVRATLAWRAIERFREARDATLPSGSLRRRVYDRVRTVVRAGSGT
jgi:hypothetical protein